MSDPSAESGGLGEETDTGARTAVFDVLTDEARCSAIEYLSMETGAVPFDELVGFVTAATVSGQEGPQPRKQAAIRFHHVHLPKMEDAGLIDYDHDDRMVTPTETLEVAVQLLDPETDTENQ